MGNERIRLMVLVTLFATTFAAVQVTARHHRQQSRQPNWDVVPYEVDGWSGFESRFDPIYGGDPSDTRLLRVYRKGDGPPVILYVGFFGELATILDVHTPELCYPAEGWEILRSGKSSAGSFRGRQIQAKEILVDKAGNRRLVVWWYNAGSRPIETRIRHVYAMLAMSVITGRTDGSMIRLETPVGSDGEAAAEKRVGEFQKTILAQLDKALPL
jgi:EpsI family protein